MTFIRNLVCALAGVGALAIPAYARALNTTRLYDVSVAQGLDPPFFPTGQILFLLLADISTACRYNYEWHGPFTPAPSVQGFVDEAKTSAHFNCTDNSLVSFSTSIQLANGLPSDGWDSFGLIEPVGAMMLGETPEGGLSGMIQFTGAVPSVDAIILQPGAPVPIPPPVPPPPHKPKPKH